MVSCFSVGNAIRRNFLPSIRQRSQSKCSSSSSSNVSKLAIGGGRLSQMDPSEYSKVIDCAYKSGIDTFQSGVGGEESLSKAYEISRPQLLKDNSELRVRLTGRVGYRSESDGGDFSKDVVLKDNATGETVRYNMSKEYLHDRIQKSPLVTLKRDGIVEENETELIYMLHNPETQKGDHAGTDAGDQVVKEALKEAFVAMEEACAAGDIQGYGVCSNGLSLPSDHPMHIHWKDLIDIACEAATLFHGSPSTPLLSILQLPANLLETNGISVSESIKSYLASSSSPHLLPRSLSTYISRPLTCYPDQGTGSSTAKPFKLIDHPIPLDLHNTQTKSSHLLTNIPPFYQSTFNLAMSHFDANHILEIQQTRPLEVEEQETLEGCRLLQSMLVELDCELVKLRSFAAYEEELFSRVIPLIKDRFEGLDEESGAVLQAFFAAHGSAARHSIAKTTRELIRKGGEGGMKYDIPQDVSMQEYALRFLLEKDSIDKVVVGCPLPLHVEEAVQAAKIIV